MPGNEQPRVHRIGFTQLSSDNPVQTRQRKVNVIFIHGLRGHPQTTWEQSQTKSAQEDATSSRPNVFKKLFPRKPPVSTRAHEYNDKDPGELSSMHKVFWPRDYLVEDVSDAEVWTYGYNADVIGGLFKAGNKNSISQHGRDLAIKLEREIENQMPIIFVTHNLGGIITKDAIRRSQNCRSRTKFIIFLGTPHRGSEQAGWGIVALNLAKVAFQDSNKPIIKSLEVNGEVLDNIQDEFLRIALKTGINIHSFQEARGISGVKGLHGKVVGDFSSKIGLPPPFETVESMDANHMQITRCNNKTDLQYRAIVGVLRQFIRRNILDNNEIRIQQLVLAHGRELEGGALLGRTKVQLSNRAGRSYHNIRLPKNRRFTGRDSVLHNLKNTLFVQKTSQKLAVVGLGGVGKTQVALELAYWAKDTQSEYSVFWASALSDESFEQAYVEMARLLDIRINKNEDLKASIRCYLESEMAGNWFLIVDNADDMDILFGPPDKPGGIYKYLPKSDNGFVLFTTRSREVAVAAAGSEVIDLHEMSPEEATRLFEKALIQKQLLQDETTTNELLEELTHLPLAITQAAAYLNQHQMSITKYLALLRGTEQSMVNLMSWEFYDDTRYRGSQNAVATTWLVSFDLIRRSDPIAADLLSFVSCIEPKAIPQSILPCSSSKEELEHAIGTLCGYTFFVRRGNDDVFDMHRLVHIATRVWNQKHNLVKQSKDNTIQHLASIFPSNPQKTHTVWKEYLPHAQYALQGSNEYQEEERFRLYYSVGCCLDADRRFNEAVAALEKTYHWRKQRLPEEDSSLLASEHTLARAYLEDRQIKEAINIFEHVVAVERKTMVEEDHSRLTSEHALAVAYLNDRRVKEAIEILEQVVAIKKKTLAEEDYSRLTSEHELASAYLDDRRTKEAIDIFEHVVAVKNKTLAEKDYSRLASAHELGRAYLDDRRIKEAIKIFEHVVTIERKTLAEKDHARLASEHELASAYLFDQRIKEAIEIFEHIVAVQQRTLTEKDHDRLASQHELARAYLNDRQIKKAIDILEHVVAVKRSLDISDEDKLVSQDLLKQAYDMLGGTYRSRQWGGSSQ